MAAFIKSQTHFIYFEFDIIHEFKHAILLVRSSHFVKNIYNFSERHKTKKQIQDRFQDYENMFRNHYIKKQNHSDRIIFMYIKR